MDCTLTLKRKWLTDKSTIGELWIDNEYECFTLEDTVREIKIPKLTAIPQGHYQIVLSFSNRFQKLLPEILNVPDFTGIRIHPGNKPEDTEGCILVGDERDNDFISGSRAAFNRLFPKLEKAAHSGKIWIDISHS